jgi:glucokinase
MATSNDSAYVLAGDVGGTKTRLGLFEKGRLRPRCVATHTFRSAEYPRFETIIDAFLARHPVSLSGACFGFAGPVTGGRAKATNLPWQVSTARLIKRYAWDRVRLLNDLTATVLAVPLLQSKEVVALNRKRVRPAETRALVAPGTGLGKAILARAGGRLLALPSEGGHADFAPTNDAQIALLAHLQRRWGHVSQERVLSGPGLVNIYNWLRDSGRADEPAWLKEQMRRGNRARRISELAIDGSSKMCQAALEHFVTILGAVAGNLALTAMATGGIYLGGGIPPKILPFLRRPAFAAGFTGKGRFSDFLKTIPVRVIVNDRAALVGAAAAAAESHSHRIWA